MKQIILPFKTGKPSLEDVPAPSLQAGHVLIRSTVSVVSPGTEGMLMDFGKAGLFGKVRQQPERVKDVLNKIRTDGLAPTLQAVRRKLDQPIALGYSQAGVVLQVGSGIADLKPGDRVASNGAHAEVVSVPRNLTAKIPEGVTDEQAAFTVLGAIALQGIRLAGPELGESIVVIGLGLIGQLAAQLLLANGCRVFGMDLHPERCALAANKGVEILSEASFETLSALNGGIGADAVIITASSDSDEIIQQAAVLCRKRGRIILTGVVGMQLRRDLFFKKELSFQVSGSYGPGRYEPAYEQHGLDYPLAYVRWTEGRNFDAVLQAMKAGRLDTGALISSRSPIEEFESVYNDLKNPARLASLLLYNDSPDTIPYIQIKSIARPATGTSLGIIGAGNYTAAILLPFLKDCGASIKSIISKNGLSAAILAKKYGIADAGTLHENMLADDDVKAVIITTPHNTHAFLTAAALAAGKHVLVEKPLALSRTEVSDIGNAQLATDATLMVGFNRRFAPMAKKAKSLLATLGGPLNIVITVNAGALPPGHWTKDAKVGGGRIAGEACHFIDLANFFSGHAIHSVCANNMTGEMDPLPENASILLRHTDGSNAVINYFCNGSKGYDKERIELYRAGHTIIIENWRSLRSFGFKKDVAVKKNQDKGHKCLLESWLKSIEDKGHPLVAAGELINSTLATIAAVESLAGNGWVSV